MYFFSSILADLTAMTDMVQHLKKIVYIGEKNIIEELHGINIKAMVRRYKNLEELLLAYSKAT